MQSAVVEPPRQNSAAGAVLDDEIEHNVLDKELGIVLEALLVKCVQHCVPGAIGSGASALRQALAPMHSVAAKRPLINPAILGARERHAEMLEFNDRLHCVAAHVFDRILVAEPVGPLDRVVHVPAPVILAHIAKRGADAALRGDRVAAGRKHLADASGLEPRCNHAECGTQPSTSGANHDDVIVLMLDWVSRGHEARLSY